MTGSVRWSDTLASAGQQARGSPGAAEKGKPVARRGRNATDLRVEMAGPPKT